MVANDPVNRWDLLGLVSPACIEASLAALEQGQKLLEKMLSYIPEDDAKGGHKTPGTDTVPGGHYRQIKELQRGLRNKLRTAYEKCKDDDDPNDKRPMPYRTLNDLANRPIVVPPGIPALEPGDIGGIRPFNSDEVVIMALVGTAVQTVRVVKALKEPAKKCVDIIWDMAPAH